MRSLPETKEITQRTSAPWVSCHLRVAAKGSFVKKGDALDPEPKRPANRIPGHHLPGTTALPVCPRRRTVEPWWLPRGANAHSGPRAKHSDSQGSRTKRALATPRLPRGEFKEMFTEVEGTNRGGGLPLRAMSHIHRGSSWRPPLPLGLRNYGWPEDLRRTERTRAKEECLPQVLPRAGCTGLPRSCRKVKTWA